MRTLKSTVEKQFCRVPGCESRGRKKKKKSVTRFLNKYSDNLGLAPNFLIPSQTFTEPLHIRFIFHASSSHCKIGIKFPFAHILFLLCMLNVYYPGKRVWGFDSYHLTSDIYNADACIKSKTLQWKKKVLREVAGSLLQPPPLGIR